MTKIELTDTELQSLVGLIDAGVKTIGLRAVKDAAVLIDKIEAAANAYQTNVVDMKKDAANG